MKEAFVFLVVISFCLGLFLGSKNDPQFLTIQNDRIKSEEVSGIEPQVQIVDNDQLNENDKALDLYNKFLRGEIRTGCGNGISIDDITIPTGEPDKRYKTGYAFFDSNKDGVPELHINSGRYYEVLSCKDNDLFIWKSLDTSRYNYAINNGAFISYKVISMTDEYSYFILDYFGNEVWRIDFSKFETDADWDLGESEYMFSDVSVTKEIWESLTRKYLYTDEEGRTQICNEIEWTILFDGAK